MTGEQTQFFKKLCARFDPRIVKQVPGSNFSYITARTIMNRLDDVCGPAGWKVEYREGAKGYIAKLSILCPPNDTNHGDGSWEWISKEDGGGFAEMTTKLRGENVPDEDNSQKSGFTSALKRVGAAWGMGRYLYPNGEPDYLYDGDVPPPRDERPQQQSQHSNGQGQQAQGGSGYDNFAIPKNPRGLFPWAKNLETHYGVSGVIAFLDKIKKDNDLPYKFGEWSDSQGLQAAIDTIRQIATWKCYKGEFDKVLAEIDGHQPDFDNAPTEAEKAASRTTEPTRQEDPEIRNIKLQLVAIAKEIGKIQTGAKVSYEWAATALKVISLTASGVQIADMTTFSNREVLMKTLNEAGLQLERAQAKASAIPQAGAVDDDIPF